MQAGSITAIPLLAAPECDCDCRAHALVEDGRVLALEGEAGLAPCDACLASFGHVATDRRPTTPLRSLEN